MVLSYARILLAKILGFPTSPAFLFGVIEVCEGKVFLFIISKVSSLLKMLFILAIRLFIYVFLFICSG